MEKSLQRSCPICKNALNGEVLHTQAFVLPEGHILSDASKYDIVSCSECGFVFADTPLGQDVYDRYYSQMSIYELDYSDLDISKYMSQARLIGSFLEDDNAKIVDMGCGNGGLLQALKTLGFKNLTAVDPSHKCIDNIRSHGISGIEGSIFQNRVTEKYDLVIVSHVLEHIVNVSAALHVLRNMLSEKGKIYIEVPDASHYADHYIVPYYYFDTEHINHFEEVSLINLGFKNGLIVNHLGKKELNLSSDIKYPAIYAVFEKTNSTGSWQTSARDRVMDYINLSKNETKTLNAICDLINSNEEIYVWGAGNYTMRLLENTSLSLCNIAGFVDKDLHKQGQKILNKTVYGTEKIQELPSETTIVVCAAIYSAEIVKEINAMNLKNKIVVL
jgi:SAM-dependent methyltransferase